jgi:hypothetical protein
MPKRRKGRDGRSTLLPLPSLVQDLPPSIRIANETAVRAEWTDPEDDKPTAAKTARQVSGYRQFCPLRWCIRRHKERSSFTAEHVVAADRLRLSFDGSRLGFSALRDWRPIQAMFYRPQTGPTATAVRQYRCRRSFDAAWSLFNDTERALLLAVVLRNIAINRVCEMTGWSKHKTTEKVVASLDKLADHYDIKQAKAAA